MNALMAGRVILDCSGRAKRRRSFSRNHAVKVGRNKRRGAENAEGRRDFFISKQSPNSDVGPSFSPSALLCVLRASAFVGTVSSAWFRLSASEAFVTFRSRRACESGVALRLPPQSMTRPTNTWLFILVVDFVFIVRSRLNVQR